VLCSFNFFVYKIFVKLYHKCDRFTLHDTFQTVKRNKQQYGLPLKIISYEASKMFYWLWLTWLMLCHSRWNIVHRPLVSIQLCLGLLPLSSSSCTCMILLSSFLSPDLFSKYSLVALFCCGLVVSTVAPVWWCCHHFFLLYVQASSISCWSLILYCNFVQKFTN